MRSFDYASEDMPINVPDEPSKDVGIVISQARLNRTEAAVMAIREGLRSLNGDWKHFETSGQIGVYKMFCKLTSSNWRNK